MCAITHVRCFKMVFWMIATLAGWVGSWLAICRIFAFIFCVCGCCCCSNSNFMHMLMWRDGKAERQRTCFTTYNMLYTYLRSNFMRLSTDEIYQIYKWIDNIIIHRLWHEQIQQECMMSKIWGGDNIEKSSLSIVI